VYNSYVDQELIEADPEQVIIEKVQRNILADKPRITRFNIDWGQENGGKSLEIENNEKKNEGFLQDKTNLSEMKNDLFRDFDKKAIVESMNKDTNGFLLGSKAETNPFLEG